MLTSQTRSQRDKPLAKDFSYSEGSGDRTVDAPNVSWVIRATKADKLHAMGLSGRGVKVGILDSGIAADCKDLHQNTIEHRTFDLHGDSIEGKALSDESGHGTNIAGLVAGGYRERTQIGIAPNVELVCGKVLEGGASIVRLLKGFDWIARQDVKVVLSCAGLPNENAVFGPMLATLRRQDILVICPVGNGGPGTSYSPGSDTNVLSVGAHNQAGIAASFSGFLRSQDGVGYTAPDILAPGVKVPTTGRAQKLRYASGTSMGAGIAAGIAALLLEAYPNCDSETLRRTLECSAANPGINVPLRSRCGNIDALAALTFLSGEVSPPKTPTGREIGRVQKWTDPRLLYQIERTEKEELLTAVFILDAITPADWASAKSSVFQIISAASKDIRYDFISRGRAMILTATPEILQNVIAAKCVTISSAADAGRMLSRWYKPKQEITQ